MKIIEMLLSSAGPIGVRWVQMGCDEILVAVDCQETSATCPDCRCMSSRVHSRYSRTIRDLPWRGTPVVLQWLVRRFFCEQADCVRQIFAERLPKLAARHGRTSVAFDRSLVKLGLECGGEAGSRLGRSEGKIASGDTILRRLRALPLDDQPVPRIIGIDDFAFRKGHSYGTVIVDHETGDVIDLLPERSSESTAAWLAEHEHVEVVTRDRSTIYASGIDAGRPEAVQAADRFHLSMNLRESLVKVLERHRGEVIEAAHAAAGRVAPVIAATEPASAAQTSTTPPTAAVPIVRPAADATIHPVVPVAAPAGSPVMVPRRLSKAAQLVADRRERRQRQYQQVVTLAKAGVTIKRIAQDVGISRGAVSKLIGADAFREKSKQRTAGVVGQALRPFAAKLREMWDAGERNAAELFRKIKPTGFVGSVHQVNRCVGPWRKTGVAGAAVIQMSSARLSWLLLKDDIDRTPQEQKLLDCLRQNCEPIRVAAEMAREFNPIFKERKAEGLLGWIGRAQAGVSAEFKSFAQGLLGDWPAVKAAVELPWSNGRTEGHVNRIKLIKRKMYGRAKFDLLRIRVMARGP